MSRRDWSIDTDTGIETADAVYCTLLTKRGKNKHVFALSALPGVTQ